MITWFSFSDGDGLGTVAVFVGLFLVYLVTCLPIVGGLIYLCYYLLTLPLRRKERSRLLLDLLELGLQDGRTPEQALLDVANSREPAVGSRINELAGQLHSGLRLSAALDRAPLVLPPQVCGMLRAGERIGDVRKVLPACRELLRDAVSHVRGANNYLILLAFCITPATILIPILVGVKVMPQFVMVAEAMGVGTMPAFSRMVFAQGGWFVAAQTVFLVLLWLLVIFFVGGPRLRRFFGSIMPGVTDTVALWLPWRKKRLQRDFSALLAILLDAEVPEAEAVWLASEATANRQMVRRGEKVRARLAQGVSLTDALRVMDDSGELRWRITNALHARGGFLRALTGWHEALDARAFQLEQTAAQVTTTGLVLFNGLMVAAIISAVFLLLINLINEVALW